MGLKGLLASVLLTIGVSACGVGTSSPLTPSSSSPSASPAPSTQPSAPPFAHQTITLDEEPPLLKRFGPDDPEYFPEVERIQPVLNNKSIASSRTPELYSRQHFKQSFNRDTTQTVDITFKLSEDDLIFRTFFLTLETAMEQSPALVNAKLTLNGQPLMQPELFSTRGIRYPKGLPHYTDDKARPRISFSPDHLKAGINTLSIDLGTASHSQLKIDLKGIVRLEKIFNAVHSKISHDPSQKDLSYIKGLMNAKFMESLRIRIRNNSAGEHEVYDENGLELSLFNDWLKKSGINFISRAFSGESIEANDQIEHRIEHNEENNKDFANQNLFIRFFHVNEDRDMWDLIEELRKFPFIEEGYPIFL